MNVRTRVKMTWHGNTFRARLINEIHMALIKALNHYRNALKSQIGLWGSMGGVWVKSSPPGKPPYRQTGNLYNSIEIALDTQPHNNEYKGGVYTDVPYAPDLEYGGLSATIDQNLKKYTAIRLTGVPFKPGRLYMIRRRPAWLPVFKKEWRTMLSFFRQIRL